VPSLPLFMIHAISPPPRIRWPAAGLATSVASLWYDAAVAASSSVAFASTAQSAPRRPAWRGFRSSVAAGVLLLVGAGAALPHRQEIGEPGHEHALRAIRVADAALHPAAPAHFESSGARLHPVCVACTLQARTPSLQSAPAGAAPAIRYTSAVSLRSAAPAPRVAIRLGPARASPHSASAHPAAL